MLNRNMRWILIIALVIAVAGLSTAQEKAQSVGATAEIVFYAGSSSNWSIYTVNTDGSNLQQLTDAPGLDALPKWSPDGEEIVFQSNRDGDWEIYVMNADGSSVRQLTSNEAADEFPNWSPDGTRICYCSNISGSFQIHSLSVSGEPVPEQLTETEEGNYQPAWSPDGQKLAFSSDRDGNAELYLLDLQTETEHRLTFHDRSDLAPAWSPDGSMIAFQTKRNSNWDIYVLDVSAVLESNDPASVESIQLTTFRGADEFPAWSPDGAMIVYESDRRTEDIYLMDSDGSNPRPIVDRAGEDYGPHWRPLPESQ